MDTSLVQTLYILPEAWGDERDFIDLRHQLIQDWNEWQLGSEHQGLFTPMLQQMNQWLEELLKKQRFIPMNQSLCFDRRIKGYWLGLCDEGFKYIGLYNSGTDLKVVLQAMKTVYSRDDVDLPTLREIKTLTQLKRVPFEIKHGRPYHPGWSILYKKRTKVQGFDTDSNALYDTDSGYARAIIRIPNPSAQGILAHWLSQGLHPLQSDLAENEFFNALSLLNLVFDDSNLIVDIKGDLKVLLKFTSIKQLPEWNQDSIIDFLQKADTRRANLMPYDRKLFTDIQQGSWEVDRHAQPLEGAVKIELDKPLVARSPDASVIEDGLIGIDFGTKSTVVVMQDDQERIVPLRVGISDWLQPPQPNHFENPTAMEFIDLQAFWQAYQAEPHRPYTLWEQVTVAHHALHNREASHSDDFNAYLVELKQWAGSKHRRLKIEDQQRQVFEIADFLSLQEGDLNPIELYAYYLGLYINNQFNQIYLHYILSFPVTYEKEVRQQILASFRRGLLRALPAISEAETRLEVVEGVSEPAAYVAVAIPHHGLDEEEELFYGVFDFGGGTTDFDFGLFRWADSSQRRERRYDYVIEQFGAGGDRYLGGENLLNRLAFALFEQNQALFLQHELVFDLPVECRAPIGSEALINDSREARLNRVNIVKALRPFWEREDWSEDYFEDGSLQVNLYQRNGQQMPALELTVDEAALKDLLQRRIAEGIDAFLEALREAVNHYQDKMQQAQLGDTIHILLAGNSSRSPLVADLFEQRIEAWLARYFEGSHGPQLKLYPPLRNDENYQEPNGKTGVAFGLIETRPGGRILVIDHNMGQEDIAFKYYLGIKKRRYFQAVIYRETPYGEWQNFGIDASEPVFEIYYTASPRATTNQLPIQDASIKKRRLKLATTDEEADIYIRLLSPTQLEYGVSRDGQNFIDQQIVELSD